MKENIELHYLVLFEPLELTQILYSFFPLLFSQRGDGFPLANMCAQVSLENKEIPPMLAAHIYTVCPTAIPQLPSPSPDASEDELMESLGMIKGKDGQFETFQRFLSRTEVSQII